MKKTVVRPSDMLRLLVGWGEGKADEPKRSATCKRANSLSPATLSSPPETALSTRLLDGSIIIETGYIDTMHSDTTNCQQKQLSDFLASVQLSKFQKPKTALYCSPFEYPTANLDAPTLPNAKAIEQRMMNTSTPSALVTNDHTHGFAGTRSVGPMTPPGPQHAVEQYNMDLSQAAMLQKLHAHSAYDVTQDVVSLDEVDVESPDVESPTACRALSPIFVAETGSLISRASHLCTGDDDAVIDDLQIDVDDLSIHDFQDVYSRIVVSEDDFLDVCEVPISAASSDLSAGSVLGARNSTMTLPASAHNPLIQPSLPVSHRNRGDSQANLSQAAARAREECLGTSQAILDAKFALQVDPLGYGGGLQD